MRKGNFLLVLICIISVVTHAQKLSWIYATNAQQWASTSLPKVNADEVSTTLATDFNVKNFLATIKGKLFNTLTWKP